MTSEFNSINYMNSLILIFNSFHRSINPSQNKSVAFFAFGEGWHNYHHVFPWDYKTAELGNYRMNMTTAFIDMFAKIGWAYDLKTVSRDIIEKRIIRTGDGTHAMASHDEEPYPEPQTPEEHTKSE